MGVLFELLAAFGKALRYSPGAAVVFALAVITGFYCIVQYFRLYELSSEDEDKTRLRLIAASILAMLGSAVWLATGLPD